MSNSFTESMAVHILANESNDRRFEDFCIELFRDVDQIEYARTSVSWDHGRDGKDVSPKSGPVPPYISCSLRSQALNKAVQDVTRILQDAKPKQLLICCSQPVSEDLEIKIESAIRSVAPSVETIRVHGQERLTQLAVRFPRALEQCYCAVSAAAIRGTRGDTIRLNLCQT